MQTVLISIFAADRPGLVAAITGRLFEIGADLGDTSFAMLGRGAEFTSVCDLPEDIPLAEVEADIKGLPGLGDARVGVRPFTMDSGSGPQGRVTHRILVSGGDRPGLVARLSEVFGEFRANIVRLDAQRVPERNLYVTRFSVFIGDRVDACLNTIANTAEELGLTCSIETVS